VPGQSTEADTGGSAAQPAVGAFTAPQFAEFEDPDIQHEGYATGDDHPKGAGYEWVCRTCFDDLKEDMRWSATGE
jgi:hypothetical protein